MATTSSSIFNDAGTEISLIPCRASARAKVADTYMGGLTQEQQSQQQSASP
jgi:hypothetical protein